MSAYYPLIRALGNAIAEKLNSNVFCVTFGGDGVNVINNVLGVRFNMDGKDPLGRKAGFLETYQI